MSGTLEHKRAATKVVKSLGLQADLRARAVVLVAADSTAGNSLRDLIQLNEDNPALKALVEDFLRGKGTGKAILCTDSMQFGKVLTADVSPVVLAQWNIQHLVCAFTGFDQHRSMVAGKVLHDSDLVRRGGRSLRSKCRL